MIIIKEEYCPKNHPCPVIHRCPVGAISQKDIFSAPEVDNDKCIKCKKCLVGCGVFNCIGCDE